MGLRLCTAISLSSKFHIHRAFQPSRTLHSKTQELRNLKAMAGRLRAASAERGVPQAPADISDYATWDHQALVARVTSLESQLRILTATLSPSDSKKQRKPRKPFDPSKYSTRHIALKFAYLGQKYNGFENHANNATPLPTIEEELWKALVKTRLIFKDADETSWKKGDILLDWEGCEYSKCGRTDKGVSAFGQVIGIRVRSLKPIERNRKDDEDESATLDDSREAPAEEDEKEKEKEWHPVDDELSYARVLNRVLPEDIRILAWAPTPHEDWSARFDCRERRYRYFFTQPCFSPLSGEAGLVNRPPHPNAERDGWLDLDAMRKAAQYFEGSNDFRNFCKLDPGKQIENFCRDIRHAGIHEASPTDAVALQYAHNANVAPLHAAQDPKVYYFEVRGSAFLWHQVRHLVAVLFLVGQGFESPEIVRDLLDVSRYPNKPFYVMADDAPLVLWDCIFPSPDGPQDVDALPWIYPEEQIEARDKRQGFSTYVDGRHGPGGINEILWSGWRRKKIDEILARSLLDLVAGQEVEPCAEAPPRRDDSFSARVFDGGSKPRLTGKYIPLGERRRMEAVEVQNARYAERKGLPPKGEVVDVNE